MTDAPVPTPSRAFVSLIGAGPGDPGLLTLRGQHALQHADVVLFDYLANPELLRWCPDARTIYVGKKGFSEYISQEQINALIVGRALEGRRVVRFKGGDSFVFGRGFEEVLACREAGVEVSVVPGLSSALSVPARAGIPVTHRGVAHELTVVSGHLPPGHPSSLVVWDAVARMRGTVVLLMAVDNAAAIAEALVAGGRPPSTPVAVLVEGTMPGERVVLCDLATLATRIEEDRLRPPAIIVVGDVVAVARPEAYPAGGA